MFKGTTLLAGALLLATGCAPFYSFTSIEDHPEQDLTVISVIASRPLAGLPIFTQSQEYWLCRDNGAELDCDRDCTPAVELDLTADNSDKVLCGVIGEGVTVKRTSHPLINVSVSKEAAAPPPVPAPTPTPEPESPETGDTPAPN